MRLATIGLLIVLSLFCAITVAPAADQAGAAPNKEKLMNPAALTEKAPDVFQAKFETTKGAFVIEVTRAWAPLGADRFHNLVKNGYYDNCRFFRVLAGFMAQFGINGDPKLNAAWRQAQIKDDPVKQSNKRGFVTYAMGGPNTRTTQLFINYNDRNSQLDSQGFSPFGKVVEGMKVVDSLYADYGEGGAGGPDQGRIQMEGNAYLEKGFPKLDYIKSAVIVAK
jgi:peptidyl-prolyl cis-trans isomerase A (cyclophilin A)